MKPHFLAALLMIAPAAHAEELPKCHLFSTEPEERIVEQVALNFCFAVSNRSTIFNNMVRQANKVTGSRRESVKTIEAMFVNMDCPHLIRTCQ